MVTAPGLTGPQHVVVRCPDTSTVQELRTRLGMGGTGPGPDPAEPLRHGYAVPARVGATGMPADGPGRSLDGSAGPRVVVVAGPDAGASAPLRPGRWLTVGRGAGCDLSVVDPTMSRRHLRVRQGRDGVTLEDLGSTNGLATEGRGGQRWAPGTTVVAGASRLALLADPPPPVRGPVAGGTVVLRPWPRPRPRLDEVHLQTPDPPALATVRAPSAWSWGLPLVAAVVAAGLLRMPLLLVFGLMAPAMVLGHHLGERRATRLEHRAALAHHQGLVLDLEQQEDRGLAAELQVRRQLAPGLLGVVRSLVPLPTTELWDRAEEPLEVVLGEAPCVSGVRVDDRRATLSTAPLVLDLAEPVVVVGEPALRDAAVRAWLLQLTTAHGPSRLGLLVRPDDLPGTGWDLLAWLPHTREDTAVPPPRSLRWGQDLLLVDRLQDAPPDRTQVVLVSSTEGVLRRPRASDQRFVPTLLSLSRARHLARSMASLTDLGPGAGGAHAPDRVATTLGDLLPWPEDVAGAVAAWSGPACLRVPVGVDGSGSVAEVDLVRDGPHALVAGTTGSGKSELLRTLVTALALRNAPDRLALLLVDYKGGSSLGECAGMPHTAGLVTDLDPHLGERVLTSLRAELRRREARLAEAGVRDVRDYRGRDVPRLVVVVDEFRVLAEELPEFLDGLVRVATVGRSLGVHLVLATQRPAGVVSADLRANVNLRIALRVRDAADSLDVLEVPDAAHLPEGRPGVALVRTGATPVRLLQVAPAAPGTEPVPEDPWDLEEAEDVWDGWRRLRRPSPRAAGPGGSTLGELPQVLTDAAAEAGHLRPTVWLPPLPSSLTTADLVDDRAWAVADRPDRQRREELQWRPDDPIAVVGSGRTGRSTVLRSLVRGAGPVWLYVLDLGRSLEASELARHPGLRSWVAPDDVAQGLRTMEVLSQLVEDRLADGGRADGARHEPVVVVVDGWERWVEAHEPVDRGRGVDLLLRLLREGPGAGVVAVLSGGRGLLTGAVAGLIAETWVLRLHDPGDVLRAGLRPQQLPRDQPVGRLVRTHDGVVAQVVVADEAPGDTAGPAPDRRPPGLPPPQVRALPRSVLPGGPWAVGGDDAEPLPLPGGSVLVLGPPRSGVSGTLQALVSGAGDGDVLRVGPGRWEDARLDSALQAFRGTVVVDDAHLLARSRAADLVLEWSARTAGRLLVGGDLEACSVLFTGLVPHVARHRTGVVLQPTSPAQGGPLGVRLPVGEPRLPGRGVLVLDGSCVRVQVAQPGISPRRDDP